MSDQDNTEGQTHNSDNALNDLLASIKNSNGEQKYKTVDEALKGLLHAQEFIPTLETELNQVRQDLNNKSEALGKMTELEQTLAELMASKEKQSPPDDTPTDAPNIDIEKIVEQTIEKRRAKELVESNQRAVANKLSEVFGTEAEKILYTKAEELGFTKEEMNSLAGRSPELLFTALGISGTGAHKQPNNSPASGTIRTEGFNDRSDSKIGRNTNPFLSGATGSQIREEVTRAKLAQQELSELGLTTKDLSNPAVFYKHFK